MEGTFLNDVLAPLVRIVPNHGKSISVQIFSMEGLGGQAQESPRTNVGHLKLSFEKFPIDVDREPTWHTHNHLQHRSRLLSLALTESVFSGFYCPLGGAIHANAAKSWWGLPPFK